MLTMHRSLLHGPAIRLPSQGVVDTARGSRRDAVGPLVPAHCRYDRPQSDLFGRRLPRPRHRRSCRMDKGCSGVERQAHTHARADSLRTVALQRWSDEKLRFAPQVIRQDCTCCADYVIRWRYGLEPARPTGEKSGVDSGVCNGVRDGRTTGKCYSGHAGITLKLNVTIDGGPANT